MLRKALFNRYILNLVSLCLLTMFSPVNANSIKIDQKSDQLPSLEQIMSGKKLVGEIHFRFLFWSVYDAYLYSDNAKFSYNENFVLRIHYLRDFSSKSIVDETIKQIKRQQGNKVSQADLSKWESQLLQIFPDIKANDQLIGVYNTNGNTLFFNGDGKLLGYVKGQLFAKSFFDIWLADNAENPNLSAKLRGLYK